MEIKKANLDISEILTLQTQWTIDWHDNATEPLDNAPWKFIELNHRMNFDLWHEEDVARRDDLPAERIKQAKRAIDKYNQALNDAMEKIDTWIESTIPPFSSDAGLHSETPGMMIDRLSIMSLKKYLMKLEAEREDASQEHQLKCSQKVMVLEEQISDLSNCLSLLIEELYTGKKKFKIYRQHKMYNDPTLNPQLYKKTN